MPVPFIPPSGKGPQPAKKSEPCKRPFPGDVYLTDESDHARMSRVANALKAVGWTFVTPQVRRAAEAKSVYLLTPRTGNFLLAKSGQLADIGPAGVRFGVIGSMTYEKNHSFTRTLVELIRAIDLCREDRGPFEKLLPG